VEHLELVELYTKRLEKHLEGHKPLLDSVKRNAEALSLSVEQLALTVGCVTSHLRNILVGKAAPNDDEVRSLEALNESLKGVCERKRKG